MKVVPIAALALSVACGAAQTPGSISPAKRALIKKVLNLTNTSQAVRASLNMSIMQAAATAPQAVVRSMPELQKVTPEQRKQIQQNFEAAVKRISTRAQAELPKVFDLDKAVDEIFVPVYDRQFTDADLKSLVAFYESPAGRKLVTAQPIIQNDAMKSANEMFGPRVGAMINPILTEERKKIAEDVRKLLAK
ncbi:MAG: DUF2059 domain-containing protein [Bryobacteraceae bacterium]